MDDTPMPRNPDELQALCDDRYAHNWRQFVATVPPEQRGDLPQLPDADKPVCGTWPHPGAIAESDRTTPDATFSPCVSPPGHADPYHRCIRFPADFAPPRGYTWRDA